MSKGEITLLPPLSVSVEMISAGVAALNAHTSDERRVLPDEEIVEIIWQAMSAVGSDPRNRTKKRT
jgi:hypothetical protein